MLETDFKRVALNLMNRVSAPGQRAQRRPWPGSEGVREGHKLRGLPTAGAPDPCLRDKPETVYACAFLSSVQLSHRRGSWEPPNL